MIRQRNLSLWVIVLMMALLAATSLACRLSGGLEQTPTIENTEPAPIIPTEALGTPEEEPDPVAMETVSEPEETIHEEEIEPAPRQTAEVSLGPEITIEEIIQGETVHFVLGYEVPEHETQFQFVFDASQWDAGKISIDLLLE